jgi:PAS domain S-box-containing protein
MIIQAPKSILLVEDDFALALVTSEILKDFGFIVITANTGEEAVKIALSNERISLILMDINLGDGIDGPEAARQILQKRNIPIVFLTSHSEKEYVDKVKKITRYGYVIKNSGDFVLHSSIDMAFELFEAHENIKAELFERRRAEESAEASRRQLGIMINKQDAAAKLRKLAEEKVKESDIQLNQRPSIDEANKLLHELRVNQIELEMQNDELHRTQIELEISRDRYFKLYDLAPIGYFTISETGLIMEANLKGASLLGVERKFLINQPLGHFIFPEDQDIYYLHCKRLLGGGEPQTIELRMRRPDETFFWAMLETSGSDDKATGKPSPNILMSDITVRKRDEEKIQTLLSEKELMLKEVHYRIINNMHTIASIMCLQLDTLKEPTAVAALKDAINRTQRMIVLYDKIYRSKDLKELSLKEYISPIMDEIIDNFPNKNIVKIVKNIDDIMIDAKILPALGIIINEILTNIMKYAFNGRDNGLIKTSATISDNRMTIVITDNGIGIPESVDVGNSQGFGLELVDTMTRSLRGKLKIERDNGTKFILEFDL